jgi:protein phosphatase
MTSAIDRRHDRGPFDIIGDVHGCLDELVELLGRLGYAVKYEGNGERRIPRVSAPAGRRALFLGDYVDRGPSSVGVLRLVLAMAEAGQALCIPGNHDAKLVRWLEGHHVQLLHGLAQTVEEMTSETESFRLHVRRFLEGLPLYLWLDEGRLAVAHAGIKAEMLGSTSGKVRSFCLYGDTTGQTDEFGFPVRRNWAARYAGTTTIVYGHTPLLEAEWLNNTICLDTGCCFGGRLTALRWPERELVSVPAARGYATPKRRLSRISRVAT